MLRFEIKPDTVFLDMLDDAIEQMIDEMDLEEPTDQDESFEINMPRSSRVFTAQQAKHQLRTLQRAIHAAELYKPTDYHWLLLYECLEQYCEIFNDLQVGVMSEKYGIESIDFAHLIDYFFWDIDFLNDDIAKLPMEMRAQLGVSPETFGLSMGMKPHPEELALKLCEPDVDTEVAKAYTPGSKKYPDFSNASP
jgi:hypothetical protein